MISPVIIAISIALIALTALGGAIALQWYGHDATQAWAAFIGAFGVLAGQQMENPTGAGDKR